MNRNSFGPRLLILIAVGACGPGAGSGERLSTVSDSAGIEIVTNSGPSEVWPTRLAFQFGMMDGESGPLFYQIRSIVVTRDGTLWVSDANEALRHYTLDGTLLGTAGGAGDGPGETPDGYGELWAADSILLAAAYSSGAYQLFAKDGTYLGARSLLVDTGGFLQPVGPSGDKWWFRAIQPPTAPGEGTNREEWRLYRARAIGEPLVHVTTVSGHPTLAVGPGHWAPGSFFDGFPSVAPAREGRLYYSHPREYQIDVISPSGVLERRIRRQTRGRRYSRGIRRDIEAAAEDGLTSTGRTPTRNRLDPLVDAVVPDSDPMWLPFVDQVLLDPGGGFWARRADLHPRPAMRAVATAFGYIPQVWPAEWWSDWSFDLFDSEGRYRASISLPGGFTPMTVSGNMIVGSMRGEYDVEYVAGFQVEPER